MFLVKFSHVEEQFGELELTDEIVFVRDVRNFEEACRKIKKSGKYQDPQHFLDCTV